MHKPRQIRPVKDSQPAAHCPTDNKTNEIVVKFMHRGYPRDRPPAGLLRQFPQGVPTWNNCRFEFNHDCREYDWLAVYHDLPSLSGFFTEEKLACPREKTILITGEPSTITVFGKDYLRQFGCILTFQEPWAVKHNNAVFHHPGLTWHYGFNFCKNEHLSWDAIALTPPLTKNQLISTMCSQRSGRITLHNQRVVFTQKLKQDISDLDIYGHGVRPVDDKAAALDPYTYHIVVENHVHQHHLTEKLPDAFLGYTLPFYHGAPNAHEYFPKESFIPIDIDDYAKSRDIIQYHLRNNEYHDRLPYIIEARRRVLEEQNLFAILSKTITEQEDEITQHTMNGVIRNRRTMRIKNPLAGLRSLVEKGGVKTYHRLCQCKHKLEKKLVIGKPKTQYLNAKTVS